MAVHAGKLWTTRATRNLSATLERLRVDRQLEEALNHGGDPLQLALVFGMVLLKIVVRREWLAVTIAIAFFIVVLSGIAAARSVPKGLVAAARSFGARSIIAPNVWCMFQALPSIHTTPFTRTTHRTCSVPSR